MHPSLLSNSEKADMKEYNVRITESALEDMEQIYIYIENVLLSPENAKGQYDRIADKILRLGIFPKKYQVVEIEPFHSKGLRRMPVDNYSVFYIIDNKEVIVTNVIYSSSDFIVRLKNDF